MYAETKTYEIHACFQGQWKTLGTFDDANQAVAEAVRLRRSRCYVGIRVIEAFHDVVDEFAARVIYRYTAARDHHSATVTTPLAVATGTASNSDAAPLARETPRPTNSAAIIQEKCMPFRFGIVLVTVILVLMTIGTA